MRQSIRGHASRFLALGLVLGALPGGTSRSELDILPSEDKARAALDRVLAAWKSGKKMGAVQGDSQKIEVVDRVWQAGCTLASFEILQPVDKPGPRWFSVKLTLQDSPEPQQVSYAVLGLDPLWVYREEDYNQMCGMGN